MVKRKKVSVSWPRGGTFLCRGHMERRFCVVVTWTNTPASPPYERPYPRHRPAKMHTASWISPSCKRVVDSFNPRHSYAIPESSRRKTTVNLIGKIQPDQKRWNLPDQVYASPQQVFFVNAEAQKPIATAAGHCMDRQCSRQKSTAPATHEYQTGIGVDNHRSARPRRSGMWMSLPWQLTIRIGYDDVDRLRRSG